MPAPGVTVTTTTQRTPRVLPTDTGVAFVVGPTSAGTPGVVYKLTSIADYTPAGLGTRTGPAAVVYDAIEDKFAEGANVVYVSRTVTSGSTVDAATALTAFSKDLGPGQVLAPGSTSDYAALLAHCASVQIRVALLDVGGTVTIGPQAGSTTLRNVPPSAAVAGLIARSDATRSVNEAPAGDLGYLRAAVDVIDPGDFAALITLATTIRGTANADFGAMFAAGHFTDAQRATLDDAGVNPIIVSPVGGVQLYGFSGIPVDSFFTNTRLRMSLTARLNSLARQFVFRTINGRVRGAFADVLRAELDREFKAGQLYGDRPEDAYDAEVPVNPTAEAAGRLVGTAWYIPGPFAERVEINLEALPVSAATSF